MKILIPLDGSHFAEAILEPAAELASRSAAEVHLIEVVKESGAGASLVSAPSRGSTFWEEYGWSGVGHPASTEHPIETVALVEPIGELEDRTHDLAEDYLENVVQRFFPDGARRKVIIGGDPTEEILKYTRWEKIDLIALATHGRTGLAKRLLGSVAAKLLNAHVAPLFLVRPDKLHDDRF